MPQRTHPRLRGIHTAGTGLLAAGLALSACTAQGETAAEESSAEGETAVEVADAVVTTYDGGIFVLDGETMEVVEDIELDGFNRLNPAGDDRHVLVSTSTGFRVLDAAGAELSDDEFEAPDPGHVVHHAGRTVLFADGTGEITVFDPDDLGDGLPETETHMTDDPHHGVAVELENGELLITDYTRKGFLDGRTARLPTIVIRPGAPNRAASGFASSVLREPLMGRSYVCPVGPEPA
jgi:hypothetical protein